MIAAVVLSALLAQAPVQTVQTATTQITSSERSSITELGLTEVEWQRYKTEMQGPRAKWSVDNDPLLVLGITAQTAQEQAHFAELYVEADRKRNAAIMNFGRAVQKVWLTKYPHEALFASNTPTSQVQVAAGATLVGPNDRVMMIVDPKVTCVACAQAIGKLLQLSRRNRTTGLDLYFVGAEYPEISRFASERFILQDDVSSKRVTLNKASAELLQQLGLKPGQVPAVFKRTASGISLMSLADLAAMQVGL
jgi:integrating conjugative element protein (TIGR03759 family)